jgi:hypothetical protein
MSTFGGCEMFTVISFPVVGATVRTHRGASAGSPCFDCAAGNGQGVSAPSLHFCERARRHEFLDEHAHLVT